MMYVHFIDMAGGYERDTVGPFEYTQLTYDELRVSPDGDVIARYHDGYWYPTYGGVTYTDIVIDKQKDFK